MKFLKNIVSRRARSTLPKKNKKISSDALAHKKVILHVGLHKTGTSSIQRFLMDNVDNLAKQGTHVFNRRGRAGVHWLAAYVKTGQKKKLNKIQQQLIEILARKDINQVVISTENFTHIKQKLFENFKLLIPVGVKLDVVIYLRRQDLLKQSVYGQVVKNGLVSCSIWDEKHYNFDFYKQCTKWQSIASQLHVRVMEKGQLFEDDLLKDFIQAIALQWDEQFTLPPKFVNEALCPDTMEFKRLLNEGKLTAEQSVKIGNQLSKYDASRKKRTKTILMNGEEAAKFYAQFAESNRMVAEEILGRENGQLFLESPDLTIQKNDVKLSTKQVVSMTTNILKQLV